MGVSLKHSICRQMSLLQGKRKLRFQEYTEIEHSVALADHHFLAVQFSTPIPISSSRAR